MRRYQVIARQYYEEAHKHLVTQPCDLGQVQANEIWVKGQRITMCLAMAL